MSNATATTNEATRVTLMVLIRLLSGLAVSAVLVP